MSAQRAILRPVGNRIRELALFAGAGGGLLASLLLGIRTVCAVEIDPYARNVLRARQADGVFEPFAIHDDVRTFNGSVWRGAVELVSGGFPCQDISVAGRGAGIDGARSGLWSEYARIVEEVEPALVFAENSPAIRSRGLGRVLGDLSALGFDAEWTYLGADDVGAPHRRKRFWLLAAHPDRVSTLQSRRRESGRAGPSEPLGNGDARHVANADGRGQSAEDGIRKERGRTANRSKEECHEGSPWTFEPDVGRMAHGVAARSHRLRAIGNGQVPLVAAVAFVELARRLGVEGVAAPEAA